MVWGEQMSGVGDDKGSVPEIKAIFFDLGGVVVTDLFPLMESYLSGLSGKPFSQVKEIRKQYWQDYELGRMDGIEFFQRQIDDLGIDLDPEAVMAKSFELIKVRPEVLEIIKALRASGKYDLGVLSNNTDEWSDYVENDLGLGEYFDAWISSSHVHVKKPDKEIFDIAASRLGLKNSECLFIDNMERNTDAAEAAGMRGLHYTCPEKLVEGLKQIGIEF